MSNSSWKNTKIEAYFIPNRAWQPSPSNYYIQHWCPINNPNPGVYITERIYKDLGIRYDIQEPYLIHPESPYHNTCVPNTNDYLDQPGKIYAQFDSLPAAQAAYIFLQSSGAFR
jgi:hypothetical protein